MKERSVRFKGREIKAYAEPVSARGLKTNAVYFSVGFLDTELLIPSMEPLVYIGRNLTDGDSGHAYFQDYASHKRGLRFGQPQEVDTTGEGKFLRQADDALGFVFEYERALDLLLACSIRRTAQSEPGK